MQVKVVAFLVLVLVVTIIGKAEATLEPSIRQSAQPLAYENVSIMVVCQTANLSITSSVTSSDASLIHFPYEIDMSADEWTNVTSVNVAFSNGFCSLGFCFENVDDNTARSIADILKVNFERVFRITYTYNSTDVSDGYVTITYIGAGVASLTRFTQDLIEDCLARDLGGFSLTFVPMTSELTALTLLVATKSSGGFDWEYSMAVTYFTSIPPGTGNHTIDVLKLLHVEMLEPSPYSDLSVAGGVVQVYGNVAFVDCGPNKAQEPGSRGWYVVPSVGGMLLAMFSFGGSSAAFTELWLTFSGVVIPEFTPPTWMAVLMLASVIASAFKKRLNCPKR